MRKGKVTKTGRSTKTTTGYVYERNLSIGIPHRGNTYLFFKCYSIKADTDTGIFSQNGGSGSGVFLNENGSLKPLGILIGSFTAKSIVCKIDKIVNDLSLQIIKYK